MVAVTSLGVLLFSPTKVEKKKKKLKILTRGRILWKL